MNPLRALHELRQSVWLDDLRRTYLDDGTLLQLINDDGVSGITSNPAIFERAIVESDTYDDAIRAGACNGDTANAIYEHLVIDDIQRAADLLRNTYNESNADDGYVSLEVSPHLANDTDSTIAEGLRLWSAVDRPNLMIKVPGTKAGLPAVTALIAQGVNVNVTLLFSPLRYREVINAYWTGLEQRLDTGRTVRNVRSVASFFLSRIDTLIDGIIDQHVSASPARGSAALTAAALAYRHSLDLYKHQRWLTLEQAGARPQRLLWASTSTKDPQYSDIKYVEALVAADTVTTLPIATLLAYRDHGEPALRFRDALKQVDLWLDRLGALKIDLEKAATQLEREGINKFVEPFDRLLENIEQKRRQFLV